MMASHTAESLQKAFKYLFPDEVPALKQLAQLLPDYPAVVNIGAGAGTSGLAFMESRDDLVLCTVDIQREDSPYGCLVAETKVLNDAGFNQTRFDVRNIQIQIDSKKLGSAWTLDKMSFSDLFGWGWGEGQVDMVFIDGDHSYEGCKGDILAWLPNIKSGGIMAIHDYKKGELFESKTDYQPDKPHPSPWLGVDKAVDEFLVGKYEQILRVDSLIAFRI